MKKPTFRNHYNTEPSEGELLPAQMPSCTVPDMTMDIQEIMDRYASGLPITGAHVPVYDGEDETEMFEDISKMDYAEREAYMDNLQAEFDDLHARHDARKQARLDRLKEKAKQGPNVQRTTGDADDQGPGDQPDPTKSEPIS